MSGYMPTRVPAESCTMACGSRTDLLENMYKALRNWKLKLLLVCIAGLQVSVIHERFATLKQEAPVIWTCTVGEDLDF